MSKTIIPTIKLLDEECNILFKSITEKLKIENPKFFYPIYKKVVDDVTMSSEELRCTMLDSKFKCKEILAKLVDSDDEAEYDSDDEQLLEKAAPKQDKKQDKNQDKNQEDEDEDEDENNDVDVLKPSSELLVGGSDDSDNEESKDECIDIMNCTEERENTY